MKKNRLQRIAEKAMNKAVLLKKQYPEMDGAELFHLCLNQLKTPEERLRTGIIRWKKILRNS